MESKYVFISYSHADLSKVLAVIKELKKRGIDVWYDEGVEAGTEWPEYIAKKIKNAEVFIAFMSPSFVGSVNCRNEINFARNCKKEMLVVYLEDTELSDGMQLQFGSIQAMFYNRSKDDSEFINNLLDAQILKGLLPGVEISIEEKTARIAKSNEQELSAQTVPLVNESAPNESDTNIQREKAKSVKKKDDEEDFDSVPDRKLKLIADILIPIFSVFTVALSAHEMHLVTRSMGGFWIFLLGVITPLVFFLPFFKVLKYKKRNCSVDVNLDIEDKSLVYLFLAFVAQNIIDPFFIHSTSNVFFKILISLGINLLAYAILFFSAEDM